MHVVLEFWFDYFWWSCHPCWLKLFQPWSCLHNSFYIFHRIHLKLFRLPSYDMKMCMWFRIFDWTISDGVIAHADICSVGQKSRLLNSFYIFHRIHWNFVDFLPMIQRCACGLRILIWLFVGVTSTAHSDLDYVPTIPSTFMIGLPWYFAECFALNWRWHM